MHSFAIICASFYRYQQLDKMLESIVNSKKTSTLDSVFLCLHTNDSKSREIVQKYCNEFPISSTYVDTVPSPGKSRNLLIEKASSDYLLFLDDDITVPEDYFGEAEKIITEHSPCLFGGPDQAVSNNEIEQKLISSILQSPFVMGPTYCRHYRDKENLEATELSLTLCNLWIKQEVFVRTNTYFDESLQRTEECELLNQLVLNDIKFCYFPQLYVYHLRRINLLQIIKVQYWSGFFRGRIIHSFKQKTNRYFLLPLATAIGIITLPFISIRILVALVVFHLLVSVFEIMRINKVLNFFELSYSYFVIAIIHSCFSMGLLFGYLTKFLK